jgi:tetratricopeptide (TPR) repeat protein
VEHLKINQKILLTFLVTILIGILIIVGFSILSTVQFSESAADDATKITLSEELKNLDRLAKDQALLLQEHFIQMKSEINFLANYAEDILNDELNIGPVTSYYGDASNDDNWVAPPNFVETQVSYEASAWYVPNIDSIDELSATTWTFVNKSSNVDYAFKTLKNTDPLIISSKIGLIHEGLYRRYPYISLAPLKNQEMLNHRDNQTITGFDPRLSSWFYTSELNQGITFSQITSTSTGPVGTVSKPIFLNNGSMMGVVALDFSFQLIEAIIHDFKLLDSGYAFIIDDIGNIVSHKELIRGSDTQQLLGVEFDSSDPEGNNEASSILSNMAEKTSGQLAYTKFGEKWYLSYHSIPIPTYVICVVAPEEEILEVGDKIQDEARQQLNQNLIIFTLIALAFTVLTFYIIKFISRKIVRPIEELTTVTEEIAAGNLHRTMQGQTGGASELTLLFRSFDGLITALRFGNEDYYAGNLHRALENYESALELFTTLENHKGIGICYNNIGNIYNAKGMLKDANRFYLDAIEIAEKLLDTSETQNAKIENTIALASRNNNIAMLYKSIERYDEAEELMNKALQYDESIDNHRGRITRKGNLGLIYMARSNFDTAKENFDEAYEMAMELNSERAIAYSKKNLGVYHNAIGDTNSAKEYFLSAIEHAEDLDIRIIASSLSSLLAIYEKDGDIANAEEVERKLMEIQEGESRYISFVLDFSGSMAGSRIRDARKGVLNIYEDQIKDTDFVSLTIFSSRVIEVFKFNKKGDSRNEFHKAINDLLRPIGGTALYDAMGIAFNTIQNLSNEQWIIVLTDGDDNSSDNFNPKSISKLAKNAVGVNLIIIGIGDLMTRDTLQQICRDSTRGTYLQIDAGVSHAITEAFEQIGTMLAEVEVEGFVPDY